MENRKMLNLDKQTVSELAGTHMKWLRFLVIVEAVLALVHTTLLLAGALLYGKESLKILKRRMENQT